MEFEIFIKDNSFLPISVDIKIGTTVVFINTDAVRHEIHCKGHANFPLLSVNGGEFAHYVFSLPGRYEISENGIGDMKCVVEATEIDRENIPKRNYFPTSKERKSMEEQIGGGKSSFISEPWEHPATENSISVHNDQPVGIRQIDEYRNKRSSSNGSYGRPVKPSSAPHSDSSDTDSGEEGNMAQQRSRVKASTIKYNKTATISTHTKENTHNSQASFQEPVSPCTAKNTAPPGSTSLPTTSSFSATTPPRTSSRHTAPLAHAPILRTKLVLIEDYAFSAATMDVVVGQWIEFRLAEDVPSHAEHEICGVSTVKQLCFESPLLQQEECTSYTYCPAHPGEIAVSCKVYPEMNCVIVVHPQTARLDATPPVSPARLSAADRRRDGTHNLRVAFLSAEKSADSHPRSALHSDMPAVNGATVSSLPLAVPPPQSPISPTSPAYQDVGEAVLQFDASKVPSPHRGYGSESQSSFYDSDDIFSDFEPAAKLQNQFDDAVDEDGEEGSRNGRSVLNEDAPSWTPHHSMSTTKLASLSASASATTLTTSTSTTNGVRKNTPHVASHVISHIVSIEEFSFRPQHLSVRCGEWVRFRRPAALVSASLVCEGEFVASEVNWPVEGDYLSLDHCFTKPGVFDVCNVIYTFCKCEVLVMLHTTPGTNGTARKGAAPKLHGSFSGPTAAPAKPIFHFPITEEEKQALKGMPQRMATPVTSTTSTTVNVTTTTTVICSSSSPTNIAALAPPTSATMSQAHIDSSDSDDTSLVQGDARVQQAKKKQGPTETTPLSKPVPLYGSFMNLSSGAGLPNPSSGGNDVPSMLPRVAVDSSIETYINRFVSKLHPLDEVSDESDAGDAGEPDAAALKRRKKNQKKKEKLKLKQKQKRQAELEQQAAMETHEPMDVVEEESESFFVHNYFHLANDSAAPSQSTLQVNTICAGNLHAAVAADRSPEAVIDRYLKDAGVSRSRIHAQIDWGEEIDLEDDVEEKATVVEGDRKEKERLSVHENAGAVSGGKPKEAAVVAVLEEGNMKRARDEKNAIEVPLAAPAAGKKKRNRSKAKRTGSFSQDNAPLQETDKTNKTAIDKVEELPVAQEAKPSTIDVVPAAMDPPASSSASSGAVPILSSPPPPPPPPQATVTSPGTPRQGQKTLLTADTSAAEANSDIAENGAYNHAASSAVLSPESFVTPTKARKPRKDKARVENASGAQPATPSAILTAAEAAVSTDCQAAVSVLHSVEPPSPAGFASPSVGDPMSRSSQLLRSALRITPQQPRRDTPSPSVLFSETSENWVDQSETSAAESTRTQLFGVEGAEDLNPESHQDFEQGHDLESVESGAQEAALLSACYAFEAQMEEFFLSRFENVMDKFRLGQTDRLPSGKEVKILYMEEQRETVVTRGKHATPHHPHDSVKVSNNIHTAKIKEPPAVSKRPQRKRK